MGVLRENVQNNGRYIEVYSLFQEFKTLHAYEYVTVGVHFEQCSVQRVEPQTPDKSKRNLYRILAFIYPVHVQ